ncbi:sensor domain-containing diguanylate cyclase [Idiomarina seosinensis]|uniref:diguanylate cyclase n=1 Tax=Idiomarina seosinensis TaxID=281739 RepID=A0A432ZHM8_9GAMM|nr:GGDEF domain-containing protein [Idiomarina seosinensis]RUO77310.1 GGDEF domain-containing protein [Idiomarina seosinensis]
MNNTNTAEAKIKQLSQRLQQSIQSRKQLENQYNRDYNTLSELVVKLTHACSGVDHELDSKLVKLRGLLQRNASMAVLESTINDTQTLIQKHTLNIQRQLKQTSEQTRATLTYLRQQSLPPKLRTKLNAIEDQMESPSIALSHYVPILLSFLELLTDPSASLSQAPKNGEHRDSAVPSKQLLNLLNQVEFDGATGQLVQRIKARLAQPVSAEQFIELVLELIKEIFKSINDERQSAQSFLLELNQTLGLVQGALQQTLKSKGEFDQRSGALNKQLLVNMQQLNDSVSKATQLAELKEQVSAHMSSINQALEQKFTLENDERRNFETQYQTVSVRLQHLERQVEQYKRQLAEQKFKSLQDSLTKLPNRAAFEERLEVEFERWARYKEPLCIAVADIDLFKRINDNFGHIAGDKTLQVLASMLRKSVKSSDFVCRYGGEEFVIIFPQTELEQALQRLEIAREKIGNIPFKFKNDDIRITISAGIAQFKQDSDTVVTVFEAADKALYEAKRRGRDQLVSANEDK